MKTIVIWPTQIYLCGVISPTYELIHPLAAQSKNLNSYGLGETSQTNPENYPMKATIRKTAWIGFLSTLSTALNANERFSQSYQFPTAEDRVVKQSNLLVRCRANPDRCPSGLTASQFGVAAENGRGSLNQPSATASANNTSVVIAGDGNSLSFSAQQTSEDNAISTSLDNEAHI